MGTNGCLYDDPGADYFTVMRDNLAALAQALGCAS